MVDGINERAAQTTEVSVVIPVYGCRNCLEELVERIGVALRPVCEAYEIILVDDNSPDQSWPRIRELSERHPAVRGLRLSRNFGQHAAISAGLQYAIGERVVVMDCDLQDVPEEIPNLLAALEGDVEVCSGSALIARTPGSSAQGRCCSTGRWGG